MSMTRNFAIAAALLPLLAACGDDHGCWNCGNFAPPAGNNGSSGGSAGEVQISLGLVTGNFANNGFPSVISTNTVTASPYSNPGKLQSILATGAGTYAAPLTISTGDDP